MYYKIVWRVFVSRKKSAYNYFWRSDAFSDKWRFFDQVMIFWPSDALPEWQIFGAERSCLFSEVDPLAKWRFWKVTLRRSGVLAKWRFGEVTCRGSEISTRKIVSKRFLIEWDYLTKNKQILNKLIFSQGEKISVASLDNFLFLAKNT